MMDSSLQVLNQFVLFFNLKMLMIMLEYHLGQSKKKEATHNKVYTADWLPSLVPTTMSQAIIYSDKYYDDNYEYRY